MFYVDTHRTTTRRDSSLIIERRFSTDDGIESEFLTTRGVSPTRAQTASVEGSSRPRGSARRELITTMFDSMLGHIVKSWDVIPEITFFKQDDNLESENEKAKEKDNKSKKTPTKTSKHALSNLVPKAKYSKTLEDGSYGPCPSQASTPFPDERAIIQFHNGNMYEGGVSMKLMNGSGRFQWADGTIYMGGFVENRMTGRGVIYWKDDAWYEGEFADNLRHGTGTYVDSRKQRSYMGQWHLGSKHGEGRMYFDGTFCNLYDGEWTHNIRHGYGIREYCFFSGYRGEWEYYVRDGKGLMVWPNHDFYRGGWKNGLMSEYGVYVWDNHTNKTMTLPNLNIYRGQWRQGKRNGFGVMRLGLIHGSFYKGEFKDNKKNGAGKLVTNSGQVILEKNLFVEDVLGCNLKEITHADCQRVRGNLFEFNLCDVYYGLTDHVGDGVKNFDREAEIRKIILDNYIERNKLYFKSEEESLISKNRSVYDLMLHKNMRDFVMFEREALRKVIHRYERDLKNIYYKYATACTPEPVHFTPVLIRLYLWQLYFDCNILEYGITLVEIDDLFFKKQHWLARTPHNPYEQIQFWQFIHSLVSVAIVMYAEKSMPVKRPETLIAEAFRTFMDKDVLPGVIQFKGKLISYGRFMPLYPFYQIYCQIGMPHTIRQFLQATRHPPSDISLIQPELLNATDDELPFGLNGYIIGDEMTYVTDEPLPMPRNREVDEEHKNGLLLYNLGNLSSQTILKIFYEIFPNVYSGDILRTLEIQITFFEFFEVFVRCAQESIRLSEELARWQEGSSLT